MADVTYIDESVDNINQDKTFILKDLQTSSML
jgi:hypothetical protein